MDSRHLVDMTPDPLNKIKRQAIGLAILNTVALAAGSYFAYLQVFNAEQTSHYIFGFVAVLYSTTMFATFFLLRMQNSITKLERLSRKLLRLDYSDRIDLTRVGEFHQLASTFNQLADQLGESQDTRKSLAEFDNLILSGADISAIIRRCLIAASMDAIQVRLYLRVDRSQVVVHYLSGMRVLSKQVPIYEMSDEAFDDAAFYQRVADQDTGCVLEAHPIACDDQFVGALAATGHRSLAAMETKRLTDLVDRLSVAITNIKHSETLYQQANFDALTGLLNRRAFEERLKECLSGARREHGIVLFLDLDGFKKVNDTSGHEAGDHLLIEIAERLRSALRPGDTIARLGGDEFAIIAPDSGDEKAITMLCRRIVQVVCTPITLNRAEHVVGTSIGIARYPDDSVTVDEIMMKADSAMYKAKNEGGSRFAFFDDDLMAANNQRLLVETRLRNAVREHTLELHFQPKINLRNWRIDSAEALLRWQDDELGSVSPTDFIGVAEDSNIIHDIMPMIIDGTTSMLTLADVNDAELDTIAINASPKQIMTEGFALSVLSMLDARGVAHERVEVEVTENVFAQDMASVLNELHILRMAGIRISLDDFGTGYSSLNMLRELPLDLVKIDRAFITEIEESEQARSMLKHIIEISKTLGLQVVAEGVETEAQLEFLVDNDCDYAQGWLIAKAQAELDFLETLTKWRAEKLAIAKTG